MIDVEGVAKRYEIGAITVTALEHLDLHVDEGEFIVVLGPSGSGKTTMLNMIGALDTPTEGSITVAGRQVTGASHSELFDYRRTTVSFIFQSFNLFPGLTARENVQFGIDAARRGSNGAANAADVLNDVGLGERVAHFPHELSGGEQQRVAIARALATRNPVLLADEPTGELDFTTGAQILELLQRQADEGKTILVVTHNREISRMADRVIEVSSGRIVHDGPPEGGRLPIADLHW